MIAFAAKRPSHGARITPGCATTAYTPATPGRKPLSGTPSLVIGRSADLADNGVSVARPASARHRTARRAREPLARFAPRRAAPLMVRQASASTSATPSGAARPGFRSYGLDLDRLDNGDARADQARAFNADDPGRPSAIFSAGGSRASSCPNARPRAAALLRGADARRLAPPRPACRETVTSFQAPMRPAA